MPKAKRVTVGSGSDNFFPPARVEQTVEQDTSEQVHHNNSVPAKQDTSIPVELMKGTYYITPEHDMKLEQVRIARKRRGIKVDKSALIREAIDLLQE